MQPAKKAGFLVAFGSSGWRGSARGLARCVAGTNVEHQSNGGSGGMLPWEIIKTGLSKMQFPAFSGSELVNQEVVLKH